eukprot:m.8970 g.8970  ORF g.8970 m.8970 type:complete len:559 (+) comp3984_c0_seq1:142-1818(+)
MMASVKLTLLLWMCSLLLSGGASNPPHIAFIVLDDLGWNDVSFQNGALPGQSNKIISPTMDKLASEGVVLDDYTVFKFCSPSRTQFLTGRYAYHVGQQTIYNLGNTSAPCGVSPNYKMIPAVLKQFGYTSRAYGKWHQGFFNESYAPTGRGFDSFFGFYSGISDFTHICPFSVWNEVPYFWTPSVNSTWPVHSPDRCGALVDFSNDSIKDGLNPAGSEYNGTDTTTAFTQAVLDDLDAHNTSVPYFGYIAFHAVHTPLEVPEKYRRLYDGIISDPDRAQLAGMVTNVDEGIGYIVNKLKSKEMWNNTIVIVTTDNGGPVCLNMSEATKHKEKCVSNCGTNNFPLRGSKMTNWQGGVRGVGLVSGGLVPIHRQGTRWGGMIHGTDWYVILLHLAGASDETIYNSTGPLPSDGVNVWDALMSDSTSPRTEIVLNIDGDLPGAIRIGDWKLMKGYPGCTSCYNANDGWWPAPEMANVSYVKDESTLPCSKSPCLFNLKDDPLEKHDVSMQYPKQVATMMERYTSYQKSEVTMEKAELCVPGPNGCITNLLRFNRTTWKPWM